MIGLILLIVGIALVYKLGFDSYIFSFISKIFGYFKTKLSFLSEVMDEHKTGMARKEAFFKQKRRAYRLRDEF